MNKGVSTDKIIGLIALLIIIISVYLSSDFWIHGYVYNNCVLSQQPEINSLIRDITIIDQKGGYKYNLFVVANCVDCIWYDTSTSELKIKYSYKQHLISPIKSEVVPYPISAQFIDFGCNCEDCDEPTGCANINEVKKYSFKVEKINNIVHVFYPEALTNPDEHKSSQPCESCTIFYKDESECLANGCYYCEVDYDRCRGEKYTSNPDACVQNKDGCGYHCLKDECGAKCSINPDCYPKVCNPDSCECVDCSTYDDDENECAEKGCYYCKVDYNGCLGNKYVSNPDVCLPDKESCGYHCIRGECGAVCGTDIECPSANCDLDTCTCKEFE